MAKNKPAELPGADLLFGGHKSSAPVPRSEPDRREERAGGTLPIKIAPMNETEPVKFTFYFPPQLLEDLEVAKFRLRMEKRIKVSKSDIVNAALSYVLKDLGFLERLMTEKLD